MAASGYKWHSGWTGDSICEEWESTVITEQYWDGWNLRTRVIQAPRKPDPEPEPIPYYEPLPLPTQFHGLHRMIAFLMRPSCLGGMK